MFLTENAINNIKINKNLRLELCLELGYSEAWILKLLKKNKKNGPLTLYAAVVIIRNHTNLHFEELLLRKIDG